MPGKKDQAGELAEKLVQTLRRQRTLGKDAYPLTLERLAALADPAALRPTILAAVRPQRKAFSGHALAARADLQAPVALQADLAELAHSPLLLDYLLVSSRTPTNHALSISKLKARLTSKLQKPFQEAIRQQMDNGSLPATVGWVLANRTQVLILLKDLHTGKRSGDIAHEAKPDGPALVAPAPAAPAEFADAFDTAFDRLDRLAGAHNFVSLVELRRELPLPRAIFDAELRHLRLAGRYTLSAVEGRQGIRAEEREAGINEDGALLLYVSRKSP
jgi:hypothetical protein